MVDITYYRTKFSYDHVNYITSNQLAYSTIYFVPLLDSVDNIKLAASPGPLLVKATTLN